MFKILIEMYELLSKMLYILNYFFFFNFEQNILDSGWHVRDFERIIQDLYGMYKVPGKTYEIFIKILETSSKVL